MSESPSFFTLLERAEQASASGNFDALDVAGKGIQEHFGHKPQCIQPLLAIARRLGESPGHLKASVRLAAYVADHREALSNLPLYARAIHLPVSAVSQEAITICERGLKAMVPDDLRVAAGEIAARHPVREPALQRMAARLWA